jgi:lipid A 4'-phosphatase
MATIEPPARATAPDLMAKHGPRLRVRELRVGLLLWLAAMLLFSLWPQIDLATSAFFYSADGGFAGQRSALIGIVHKTVPWIGRLCALLALAVALQQWLRPGSLNVRWRRRIVQLGWVVALGVGLLVNGALKEGWGRARPQAVAEFNGQARFTPALQPTSQCPTNCSFVSGHAATGFAFMALGLFGSRAVRRRSLLVGVTAGAVLGAIRISQGGHFASDIVFAGLVVWSTGWLLREAWLRLRARRLRRRRGAAPPPPLP